MTTLSPLFLEQEIWLKMASDGRYGYTRKPEDGVTFINVEVDIEAHTLGNWDITEIRAEMGNSKHSKPVFAIMPLIMFHGLRTFLLDDFADELQCHVDKELLPDLPADHADRIYDERNS